MNLNRKYLFSGLATAFSPTREDGPILVVLYLRGVFPSSIEVRCFVGTGTLTGTLDLVAWLLTDTEVGQIPRQPLPQLLENNKDEREGKDK